MLGIAEAFAALEDPRRPNARHHQLLNQPTAESDTHATAAEERAACLFKACVTSASW
jgi:hypothetical protein